MRIRIWVQTEISQNWSEPYKSYKYRPVAALLVTLYSLRGCSHIAPKNAWKTLGAPLSPFFQSARAVALGRRLSLLSNHQLCSPHCYSYLSQNNEGLTSHKVQEIPGPRWWAAPPFFCWGFKVTEKVRKLIGWFLSHDLRCACGILKIWDVFISMRRGRAWKKRARRTATASLPLWARIPRVYIWNNELERAKDAICEQPLILILQFAFFYRISTIYQNKTATHGWSKSVLLTHVWERGAEWGKAQPQSTAHRPTRLLLHGQPADLLQSSDTHWAHCGLYIGQDKNTVYGIYNILPKVLAPLLMNRFDYFSNF